MVTACPASSLLVRSEKKMPLSLRTSVEVPTAPAELVTGLVLIGLLAVGGRPGTTDEDERDQPDKGKGHKHSSLHDASPGGIGTSQKGGRLDESAAPHKLG
jgi:hypothetical protein